MKTAAVLALLACSLAPARAMSPEDQAMIDRGLDALYRCDYDGADRIFHDALVKKPGAPIPSVGAATAAWWRMENQLSLPGSPEEETFKNAVKDAIRAADHAEDHSGAEGYLQSSLAYGLRGRWEAANKHWFAAYMDGRRAYHLADKAVKLDPKLYDAYLALGVFDYYVATLSRFLRAFSFTHGAGKEKGLEELRLAEQGHITGTAAKLLLVGIDWTFEKKPQEAWDILDEVHRQYPDSPIVDSMRLIGLFHLKDGAGLQAQARVYLEKAERATSHFTPIDKSVGHGFIGLGKQISGDYAGALELYATALSEAPEKNRWRSVVRLFTGECLDMLARRGDAEASYHAALKETPLWGVPRYAKFLLKHRFEKDDDPLPPRGDKLQ